MGARVAVVLSGCGFMDGSEIHESVLTLLALDRAGADVQCFAPDIDQARVVDHLSGESMAETRNALVESARIARGDIRDVADAQADDFDAVMLPGGFGAALSLCDFATQGERGTVHPGVARLLREMHAESKPIGAICIAPALVALALGEEHPTLTIGNDADTARAIEGCGAKHRDCPVDEAIVDRAQKIVTTPAYMLGPNIRHVAAGVERCVAEVLQLVEPAAVS